MEIPENYKYMETLENGDQIYSWNDIKFLSGTAGTVLVREHKIIALISFCMS